MIVTYLNIANNSGDGFGVLPANKVRKCETLQVAVVTRVAPAGFSRLPRK